ncbi:LysR family transcriptional regulator [Sporosarcina sp. Marseille-Q4063]|uniref:LysR family transcriptional regulator n=1 Tax=Sporosarcina sp. Marseille-Q4063 TaxID=2810514 RepID=UPI001BAEC7A2|nr:LysR family transcriptional regulator [Sporosarcina sp. Marseille-Q4063]QUW21260.1 LysR family transcriptional regulator [Sporosarcina sp. Marseille-Q4063]
MNLKQVQAFLSIVRLGNISKAANHLYVTQSAISLRLNSLEKEYDIVLLNREQGVRRVTLTSEGERFYQIALKYESLISETRNIKSMRE